MFGIVICLVNMWPLSALTSLMTCSSAVSLFPILEFCVADDSRSLCG